MTIQTAEIIKLARAHLRQRKESQSNWDNADLMVFINSAVRQIVRDAHTVRLSREYTGTGEKQYPLPGDLVKPEKLTGPAGVTPWLTIESAVSASRTELFDLYTGPAGALIKGDFLYILPSLQEGAKRFLHYIGYPPNDLSSPVSAYDIPRTLLDVIAFRVTSDCYREISNTAKADFFEAKYAAEKVAVESQERQRQHPGPNVIARPRIPRRDRH